VVDLVTATLEAMARLAPKAKLAESLTALDPNIPEERALMLELMEMAFCEAGMVDRIDFIEDMVFFLKARGRSGSPATDSAWLLSACAAAACVLRQPTVRHARSPRTSRTRGWWRRWRRGAWTWAT
jgi:hypothetical protein